MVISTYIDGFRDGLELAIYLLYENKTKKEVIKKLNYYLSLVKENKFEKLRMELGAFK